jgi:hypothetical protein
MCNIPDSHLVKRFLQEQSFLFHTWYLQIGTKLVLTYSAPLQLCNFFFDPGRSQHLYSVSWIIGKCWEAVECVMELQLNRRDSVLSLQIASGLCLFFEPQKYCQFSRASLILGAESIRNGSDTDSLLAFLKFLSRIPWPDICFSSHSNGLRWAQAIAKWVCKSLVSEHVPNYVDHLLTKIYIRNHHHFRAATFATLCTRLLTRLFPVVSYQRFASVISGSRKRGFLMTKMVLCA